MIKLDYDHTLENLAIQHRPSEHITHTSLNATTFVAAYDKCGSDYRLWEDKGDTCVRVCEISVKHVYVVRTTHSHKGFPLKQNKPPFS